MEAWIKAEIAAGMQRLLCLKLERAPGVRVIRHTLDEWCKAIEADHIWISYRDAARFRKAFTILARNCHSWPAPADFIEALPPIIQDAVVEPKKKESKENESEKKDLAHTHTEIDKIISLLYGKAAGAGSDK